MTTRDDIKKLMAYMACAFSNYHPVLEGEINAVDVMFDLLGDLPIETLQAAVKYCCAEPGRQFAPSAGEIRGAVSQMRIKIDNVPSAGEAWGAIIGSFERMPGGNMAGGGHGPVLDHPLVQKALHCMGGYAAIGSDFFENQMANRAHFLRIYADLLNSWKNDAAELPAITDYVEDKRIEVNKQVKLLSAKLAAFGIVQE